MGFFLELVQRTIKKIIRDAGYLAKMTTVIPVDILIQILTFLDIVELARASGVAKWWHNIIFGTNQECWYYTTRRWKFGWHVDFNLFGPRAFRNHAISRHRMDHLVELFFRGRTCMNEDGTRLWMQMTSMDERSLDCLLGLLKEELASSQLPKKSICFPSAMSYLCERMLVSQLSEKPLSFFDMEVSGAETDQVDLARLATGASLFPFKEPASLTLPAVFYGRFTQVFELQNAFGHFFSEPSYCRSEWSFSLVLESLSNSYTTANSAWPLVACPISGGPLAAKKRQNVKAYCCWKKEEQLSSPTLAALSELPMGYPAVGWIMGLYAGVGKPVISVSEGFFQPEDGLLYLSATGHALIRPEHTYPNIPGRSGM